MSAVMLASSAFRSITLRTRQLLPRVAVGTTRTLSGSSSEENLRKDLATCHRLIAHSGLDELHWNHISARVAGASTEGVRYLVTPGDKHFACMQPEDLALVDGHISGDLSNVTADVIHGAIYKARPDVGAILHLHSEAGMWVSCLPEQEPLKYYTQDAGGFWGKVAYYDFQGVADEHEEQADIVNAMEAKTAHDHLPDVLIMRNHGTTCCGQTIGEVYTKNFYLDRVCRLQMNLAQSGAAPTEIPEPVLAKMAKQFEDPQFKHGCEWPAMVEFAKVHLGCTWH